MVGTANTLIRLDNHRLVCVCPVHRPHVGFGVCLDWNISPNNIDNALPETFYLRKSIS